MRNKSMYFVKILSLRKSVVQAYLLRRETECSEGCRQMTRRVSIVSFPKLFAQVCSSSRINGKQRSIPDRNKFLPRSRSACTGLIWHRKSRHINICAYLARKRLKLRRETNPLRLFPAWEFLVSVGGEILGLLPKKKSGMRFLMVITDLFWKLGQIIPLNKNNETCTVPRAFTDIWEFKNGEPETVLTDTGSQFSSELLGMVCVAMGIENEFIGTYHPHFNNQTELYNLTDLWILLCYLSDHQRDWD